MAHNSKKNDNALNVVMVVDNAIIGDSRVQKSAAAVAACGHRVTLFGTDFGKKKPSIKGVAIRLMPNLDPKNIVVKTPVIEKVLIPLISIIFILAYSSQERVLEGSARVVSVRERIKKARGKKSVKGLVLIAYYLPKKAVHNARVKLRTFRGKLEKRVKHLSQKHKPVQKSQAPTDVNVPTINAHFEQEFVQAVVDMKPDVIHTHDYKCVSVGALAKKQLREQGRETFWIYDAHEFLPGLAQYSEAWREAQCHNEATYIGDADLVVTVSEKIADMLVERHKLNHQPKVVLNAPAVREAKESNRNIRKDCGIGDDVPLAVYLGGVTPLRGLDVVVQALVDTTTLHVCLVATRNIHVDKIESNAADAGVLNRLHVVPYVDPAEIISYIRPATLGLVPLLYSLNHASALPSKFYEYANAELPIVGSNVEVVAETITRTGVGEVFIAGDSEDFSRALTLVLGNPSQYAARYRESGLKEHTWENQESILCSIYDEISSLGH
jgi:glycosyltransferase involved in cell wall biosynthesis